MQHAKARSNGTAKVRTQGGTVIGNAETVKRNVDWTIDQMMRASMEDGKTYVASVGIFADDDAQEFRAVISWQ